MAVVVNRSIKVANKLEALFWVANGTYCDIDPASEKNGSLRADASGELGEQFGVAGG
jgi:hypothetical protein